MHLPFNLYKNYDINFKLLAILPGNWDIFITATKKWHGNCIFFLNFISSLFTLYPVLFYKRNQHSKLGKMGLRDMSPPSSGSSGFPNKITIACPKTPSLDEVYIPLLTLLNIDKRLPYSALLRKQEQWGTKEIQNEQISQIKRGF